MSLDPNLSDGFDQIDPDVFAQYIGRPRPFGIDSEEWAERFLGTASQLIAASYRVASIPAETLELATLQVASELFIRRDNPGGIVANLFEGGGSVSRLGRDALVSVRSMLAPWRKLVVG